MNRKYRHVLLPLTIAVLMSACGGAVDKPDDTSESLKDAQVIAETTEAPGSTQPPENADNESYASVMFSAESGFYPEAIELTLTASEGDIYYTSDGSDPTGSGALAYTSPIMITNRKNDKNVVSAVEPSLIAGSFCELDEERTGFVTTVSAPSDEEVDKCTVIRTAVKLSDGTFSECANSVYFVGSADEHIKGYAESCKAAGKPLAVISLAVGYKDFFDSKTGIYVKGDLFDESLEQYLKENKKIKDADIARRLAANYNQRGSEWERTAAMTFIELSADGGAETVLSQNCGVRVQGNYSRSDLQKGLRLYARKEYGKKNFKYAVFGEDYHDDSGKTINKFKKLVLRAGGNCAFTSKFNDAYWQSLVRDTACETKRSRPCVVYLNGEYWGLYVLEEDYSDDFFESVHGVNKDDVVVYKGDAETYKLGYKLDEGELPDGENEDFYFRGLNDFFRKHSDCRSDADYEELFRLVDPQSVMDYFAVECWINNKWDWPGKNWSMWKTRNTDPAVPYADGRWRFMFYDVEFGGVSGEDDIKTNTIREDNYKPKGLLDMDTKNPAVLCFAYMMTNAGFRESFKARITGLTDGLFEKDAALKRLGEFESIYSPLFGQFFERYPGTGTYEDALYGSYASAKCIRDFVSARGEYIEKMLKYVDKALG